MKPVRIAQVMGRMDAGGVESAVMNCYRCLDRGQYQFDFIISRESSCPVEQEIYALGGRVFRVASKREPIILSRELYRLFSAERYLAVHAHLNTLNPFVLGAADRAGVQVRISHCHSTASPEEIIRTACKYLLRPLSGCFATQLCACSEWAGKWMFGTKQFDQGRVKILPDAVDCERFAFSPQVRQEVRRRLGLEAGQFAVGHIGRFERQKNHSFLLRVFEQVLRAEPSAVLLLVGEGTLEQDMKRLAVQLGISGQVRFLGVSPRVEDWLQALDVFLFPSLYEGFGMALLEAQVSGLPVVLSDRIPQEAVLCEQAVSLSLNRTASEWAEAVLRYKGRQRRACTLCLREHGLELSQAVIELEEFYRMAITQSDAR